MRKLALILIGVLWCAESIAGTADARDFERDNTEYFSISDATQTGLDINGHNEFYMCAWVKRESVDVIFDVMSKWYQNTSAKYQYLIGINTANNFFTYFSTTTVNSSTSFPSGTTSGVWYFVQVYHDPTNDLIGISVNNGNFDTVAYSAGIVDGTAEFRIGARENLATCYADGLIQSAAVYSSIPSSSVRTSLYNSGIAKLHCQLTAAEKVGLVSYWNLDEQSGNAIDSHGSNDLTDNNTVLYGTGLASDICPSAGGSIKKVSGVAWASVSKVSGVAKASIKKIIGVDAS
jgi:hypothetical protein